MKYASKKLQFPQAASRKQAAMAKLEYLEQLASFGRARRRILDSKLNAFERAMYRGRLLNVMKKVRVWFWQGRFEDDHYSLPDGYRGVLRYAVFHSEGWGYRDKSDEVVKFFRSLDEALKFAAHCESFHSLMDTETGDEYWIELTASVGQLVPNRCDECFGVHMHVEGCKGRRL